MKDWSAWRITLCDSQGMPLLTLPITSAGGSHSYANPNLSTLTRRSKGGEESILFAVSSFMPTEGNGAGEAGELIYLVDSKQTKPSRSGLHQAEV